MRAALGIERCCPHGLMDQGLDDSIAAGLRNRDGLKALKTRFLVAALLGMARDGTLCCAPDAGRTSPPRYYPLLGAHHLPALHGTLPLPSRARVLHAGGRANGDAGRLLH